MDCLHDITPSIAGEWALEAEPVNIRWVGKHLRLALRTARPSNPETPYDQVEGDRIKQQGIERETAFFKEIADKFGYKTAKAAFADTFIVSVHLRLDAPDDMKIYPTNHFRSGGYGPLANDPKHKDKFIQLALDQSSDEEIGTAVRAMLDISLLGGKRPKPIS